MFLLDKAIEHGKEHRKPYMNAKAIACGCRNHGTCDWCLGNRMYKYEKKKNACEKEIERWKKYGEEI